MGIILMDDNLSKTGGNPSLMPMGTMINLPYGHKQCTKLPGIDICWFVGDFLASALLSGTVDTI